MFRRRSRPSPTPTLASELAALHRAVLAERQPLAVAAAAQLHGRRVRRAAWDASSGALTLTVDRPEPVVLLCDDVVVAAQVAAMCALEESRAVTVAVGGVVHLEVWSASWCYRLAGVPAG